MTEASFEHRYDVIDEKNKKSWYMNDADRPFTVIQSTHSAGRPRTPIAGIESAEEVDFIRERNRAARTIDDQQLGGGRFELGGNMSTVRQGDKVPYGPSDLTDEGRYKNALANMMNHFEQIGVDPADVRVLNPERDYSTPLTVVNVDEDPGVYKGGEPVKLEKSGDFIYSYNPDIVLAVRPADCPIAVISGDTPKGKIDIMVHFAWRGPASGQLEDMQRELDLLGVDYSSMKVYITPGGHSESYQFKGYKPDGKNNPEPTRARLFTGLEEHPDENGPSSYSFGIDTPNDVYEAFKDLGLEDEQLFLDTTDTTSLEAGVASHSRAMNLKDDNVRDLVTVQFTPKSI